MNEDTQFIAQLAARVAMHEFLLEQVTANLFNQTPNPATAWAEFGAGFVTKMSQPWTATTPTPDQLEWLQLQQELGVELAQNFVQKVAKRIVQGAQ